MTSANRVDSVKPVNVKLIVDTSLQDLLPGLGYNARFSRTGILACPFAALKPDRQECRSYRDGTITCH